jgi:repressor LexA
MSTVQVQSPKAPPKLSASTEGDAEHLAALQQYWKRHRTFPSMARLAGVLGLRSAAGLFGVLGRLTAAGYLERVERRIAPTKRFFERRVLAATCAEPPLLAAKDRYESLNLDDYLIDDPGRTTLHRVHGNHLCEVGIRDGDIVVVELRAPSQPGDIVLAVCDGGIDVKTFRRRGDGGNLLDPAATAGDSVYRVASVEVLGVVISFARRLRRPLVQLTTVADCAAVP